MGARHRAPSLAKMDDPDERGLVERGYDALSYHYRADDAGDGQYAPWLAALHRRLPGAAAVLDLGCGCGVPAARFLAAAWCPPGPSAAPTPPASTCPHPPAPVRAAPPHRAHLYLAAPGRLAAGHRRRQRLDRHRGQLARRPRRHVVEPCRRVDLPLLAAGRRAAGHRRGVRARGDGRARPLLGPPTPSLTRSSGPSRPCRAGGGIPAAGHPHVADMAGPAPPSAGSGRRSLSISRRLWCAVSRCVAPGGWSMHSMNFHDWRARSECSPNEGPRGTRERRGITPPGRASCRSVGLVAVQAEPGHRGLCCPQCVWHHHGIFTPPVLPVS